MSDFGLIPERPSGRYAKWDTPGDTVDGLIVSMTIDGGTTKNGDPCPEVVITPATIVGGNDLMLQLTEDDNVIVTCSQYQLKTAVEANPGRFAVGNRARIEFLQEQKLPNGNTKKVFKVGADGQATVTNGSAPVAPAAIPDDALDF